MLEELRRRLQALAEERATRMAAMGAVISAAEARAEGERSLTPDEDAQFATLLGEIRGLDTEAEAIEARVADLEAIEARTRAAHQSAPFNINRAEDPFDLSTLRYGDGRNELGARVRSILDDDTSMRSQITPDEKQAVLDLMRRADTPNGALARRILITGKDAYRTAFEKVMNGNEFGLTDAERSAMSEMRAASLTDSAGGYAVPFTLDPTIIDTGDHSVNPFRMLGTVKSTVTDNWNGVTSAGVTASWDAEGAEVSDDAPTLAPAAITPVKAQAFVPYSIEIGMDWANMEADIRAMISQSRDDLEATAHAVGTGSGQPTGVVTALDGTASELSPLVAETFAVGDLFAMEESLAARYRARASWVANKAIFNDVRAFGVSDSYALWERLGGGQPAQLLGYGAYEASAMDSGFNAAATADNFILTFGDFSAYYIVDRVGMVVDNIPHLFHTNNNRPSGQRGIYAMWRTGADVVNINALRVLNVATTA